MIEIQPLVYNAYKSRTGHLVVHNIIPSLGVCKMLAFVQIVLQKKNSILLELKDDLFVSQTLLI